MSDTSDKPDRPTLAEFAELLGRPVPPWQRKLIAALERGKRLQVSLTRRKVKP